MKRALKLPRLVTRPGRGGTAGLRRRAERPLNLARRPFVNRRPVARTAAILAVGGAVLLALNVVLYTRYVADRRADASELTRLEAEAAEERRQIAAARAELAAADVGHQNRLVTYLNRRIDERTFGWSVLFDRLADLLPEDVRLESLAPRMGEGPDPRRPATGVAERRVSLGILARARDGESVLRFVDALFADPTFENPNLKQETLRDGEVAFSLDVVYLPDRAEAMAGGAAPATLAAAAVDGTDPAAAGAEEEQ